MRIIKENSEINSNDCSIGINDEHDLGKELKIKRCLMYKISIILTILAFSSGIFCHYSLTDGSYVYASNTTNKNVRQNIFETPNFIRYKRELEKCDSCENDLQSLDNLIAECRHRITEHLDCCELYEKIKRLNEAIRQVEKEFDLYNIPCRKALNHNYLLNDSYEKSSEETPSTSYFEISVKTNDTSDSDNEEKGDETTEQLFTETFTISYDNSEKSQETLKEDYSTKSSIEEPTIYNNEEDKFSKLIDDNNKIVNHIIDEDSITNDFKENFKTTTDTEQEPEDTTISKDEIIIHMYENRGTNTDFPSTTGNSLINYNTDIYHQISNLDQSTYDNYDTEDTTEIPLNLYYALINKNYTHPFPYQKNYLTTISEEEITSASNSYSKENNDITSTALAVYEDSKYEDKPQNSQENETFYEDKEQNSYTEESNSYFGSNEDLEDEEKLKFNITISLKTEGPPNDVNISIINSNSKGISVENQDEENITKKDLLISITSQDEENERKKYMQELNKTVIDHIMATTELLEKYSEKFNPKNYSTTITSYLNIDSNEIDTISEDENSKISINYSEDEQFNTKESLEFAEPITSNKPEYSTTNNYFEDNITSKNVHNIMNQNRDMVEDVTITTQNVEEPENSSSEQESCNDDNCVTIIIKEVRNEKTTYNNISERSKFTTTENDLFIDTLESEHDYPIFTVLHAFGDQNKRNDTIEKQFNLSAIMEYDEDDLDSNEFNLKESLSQTSTQSTVTEYKPFTVTETNPFNEDKNNCTNQGDEKCTSNLQNRDESTTKIMNSDETTMALEKSNIMELIDKNLKSTHDFRSTNSNESKNKKDKSNSVEHSNESVSGDVSNEENIFNKIKHQFITSTDSMEPEKISVESTETPTENEKSVDQTTISDISTTKIEKNSIENVQPEKEFKEETDLTTPFDITTETIFSTINSITTDNLISDSSIEKNSAVTSSSETENNTISNASFEKNSIVTSVSETETTFSNSNFEENSAITSLPEIENNTISSTSFEKNSAVTSLPETESSTISDSTFEKNSSITSLPETKNTISNSNFEENSAVTSLPETESSTIFDSSFEKNSSITSVPETKNTISNSNFEENSAVTSSSETENNTISDSSFEKNNQLRNPDPSINDMRIVNQNPIAQRFQNMGVSNKFDNLFQLPPVESSKASQQLNINTNMMPLCFYGFPNQNNYGLRQPGFESQFNPFSMSHTAYSAFGYPQMYPNNFGQMPMYNMLNSMVAQQKYPTNFFNPNPFSTNPYYCTYVPSSSLQFPPISSTPEFRNTDNKKKEIPEDLDDKRIPENFLNTLYTNKSRSSLHCLSNERSCFDNSRCIKENHWCDGIIHCKDKSDEMLCSCKTRVDKSRLCDGYFDCPNGEDELGCFGCSKNEFSCDDWSERQKTATCVSLNERCDGVTQCKTGKDEMDCSLLTNTVDVHQTYAVSKSSGFLHRNYKGSWYPVCSYPDSWVLEACLAEVGPQSTFPIVHSLPVPASYSGEFLTALQDKKVEFLKSCMGGEAVYVICPPIPCGTRLIPPPNHFRKQEVDTSAEDDFFPFVNRIKRYTNEMEKLKIFHDILLTNDIDDKNRYETLISKQNQYINPLRNKDMSWEEQERNKRGDNRVVGGKPSQPTSWPWVVAIYRDGIFHCGGVLMSELWVITAAHCVDTYWQHYYEVQAGMLRRFSFSPMEQNRVVAEVIAHQMYDRGNMKHDLALLKVAKPFQFNRWVRPVCLPSESSAGSNWMWGPQPGTICTAVGWGATVEHGPDPDHMREVEVPILPQCKHQEDQEGQEICAGYIDGGRDACQGDSGGPLLCRNPLAPSQWYVAGIVSHGEGCARPNEPGAYTRVSLYLNWITTNLLEENLSKRKPVQKCPGTMCMGIRRCISKKRRCDKAVDCLIADDEINCPKINFPSLIKHAFENMLLLSTNNETNFNDTSSNMNSTEQESNEKLNLSNDKEIIRSDNQIDQNDEDNNHTSKIVSSKAINDEVIENFFLEENNINQFQNKSKKTPLFFECKKLLQLIPIKRRCDKILDCEDGTDEKHCTCKEYLLVTNPNAICDGVIDCLDRTDEKNCLNCSSTEFHCHLSKECIPKQLQCNHAPDCFFSEDEWDCFALINGVQVKYDNDGRPELRSKGIMSFSYSGKWFPMCNDNWYATAPDVVGDMCAYLGFSGYNKYFETEVPQNALQITSINESINEISSNSNKTCRTLYVKCSNLLSDTGDTKLYTAHQSGVNTFKEVLMNPWNAAIFADGTYMCSGTIIDKNWIITSRICLHNTYLHLNYTVAMLGIGRGHYNVIGPHEQIRVIIEMVPLIMTDVILLRLEEPMHFTRYVRPLYIRHINNDIISEKETCVVTGRDNNIMQTLILKPTLSKCMLGKRCFKRVTPLTNCNSSSKFAWGGTVVCLSESGWYPAAIFYDQTGLCGFQQTAEYTSIRHIKTKILAAINKQYFPVIPPSCAGLRCPLGQCLPHNRVCDGISDCKDGSDETQEICDEKARHCSISNTCGCAPNELTCKNGKCVDKGAFCDRVNNCGDWSDEPARCNCSAYLELVAPHRLCDGISNCDDKSDESPRICGCRPNSFKCKKSELCIPNEYVCDGTFDCPDKEDEKFCIALKALDNERDGVGEVVLRSYGLWHSFCMPNETLTIPDLKDICKELHYPGTHAAIVNKTFSNPAQDIVVEHFSWVRLNKYLIMFVKGDYPIAKLENNDNCNRLYIECTVS